MHVTDEMVEAALQGAEYIPNPANRSWMRAALEAALRAAPAAEPQCCMCGKTGLSTVEGDGGSECQLSDGRWACSFECWERATERDAPPAPVADGFAVAVAWHTARAKHTPDVFEQELHKKSAAAIRALSTGTPLDEAGLAALDATRFAPVADGGRDRYRRAALEEGRDE